jgi:hypothetical protein
MALREVLAHFGVDVDTEELEKANKKVDDFVDRLKSLGTALVGGEFAKEIFEFGKSIAEQGDQLEKGAIRLGLSTDALQALGYAAVQSGSDIGSLTIALLTLQDKIGDALINPTGEGAKALHRYGIEWKDAKGHVKDAGDVFKSVADKIADTKDQSKQVAIAMGVFGRQGRALLPLLKQGSDGIGELTEQFEALGGGISEKAIKASSKYIDAIGRLNVVHQAMNSQIALRLLPVLTLLVDGLTKGELAMVGLADHSSIVETVLAGLGAVLVGFAIKSAIAFAPWIAWGAALAGVILIVEDLVTMFRGGDSLSGRLLDAIGGEGFHTEVVKELGDEWAHIRDVFHDLNPVFHEFVEELRWIYHFGKDVAQLLGKISGAVGDAAGRAHNYLVEKGVVKGGPTVNGGLTYEQNVAQQQGGRLFAAQERGEQFQLSEVPPSFKGFEQNFMQDVTSWANSIRAQRESISKSPLSAVPGVGGVFTQTNTIHVHDASDPVKTAKVVDDHLKRRHRAAADVLHKKAESK